MAAVTALFAVSWSMLLVSSGGRLAPAVLATAVVFTALAAALTVRGALVLLGRHDVWAAVGVSLVTEAVFAVERPSLIVVGLRCEPTAATVLVAIGFGPRRLAWPVSLAVIGAQIAASWPMDGPAAAVQGTWPVLAAAVAAAVLGPLLRTAGARADAAQEQALTAGATAARAQARREAHHRFQDLLHDEVSSALRAVSMPGIATTQVRQACRSAVDALLRVPAAPGQAADLAALLTRLTAGGGPPLSVEVSGAVPVPAEVAEAALGAAAEAVRNAVRHAEAQALKVRLRGDEHGFVLSVADDGVGFSPAGVQVSSVGLRRSVLRRMADVAGTAEVHSSPGDGTTVRLVWQRARAVRTGEFRGAAAETPDRMASIRAAVGDVRRPLAAVCVPYLLATGVVAAIHTVRSPRVSWLMVWYVLLAAVTVALLLRARTAIGGRAAAAASAFAVGGAVGSFLVIPTSGIADDTSWPIGAVTPLLTVLVIVRPPWEALLALVLEQAGVVLVLLAGPPFADSWGESVAKAVPALFAPALGVGMGLAIGQTVARLGAAVMRANAERAASAAVESARQAREAVHRRRLADLDEEILSFLRRTASGDLSPQASQIRVRARMLDLAVRDELHLPGALGRSTRELLGAARAEGCVVTIQSDADHPPPPDLLRRLLTCALGTGPAPSDLILSVEPRPSALLVSLVTLPGDPARAAALRKALTGTSAVVEDGTESTWVEVSTHAAGVVAPPTAVPIDGDSAIGAPAAG
ncbi:ATP-binding protein [Streptomyces sp. P3]|uniref:ATP-binding protein n=1 Tax=Streptomyces sp. P3 TaxID=2135430 RepID=UPI00131ED1F9|nr:ATP-binding protein [Streptomyces sp. P3]